nr:uncharacterized protein LOC109184888 [Ipomoea batatas]
MPNGESFRQKVIYEVNPCYSTKCKSNEHFLDDCTINKPWIKKKGKKAKTTLNNQEVATVTTEPSQYTDHVPSDTSTPCTDVAVGDLACIGSEDAIPLEDKVVSEKSKQGIGLKWVARLSLALACFVDLLKFDCISDQCPMVVKLFDNSCEGNRLFKIFNMWLTHPRFHSILEEGWGSTVIGTKQFLVAAKLKALKTLLKEFNKLEFGYISERDKRENEEFQAFIHNFNVEFASEKDRERIKNLRERACFLAKAESLFFCQKLKTRHLIQADRSSKYFHDLIRKQHRDVAINFILDQYGDPTTFIAQVGSLLIIFSICLGKQGAGETVNMSSSFKGQEST